MLKGVRGVFVEGGVQQARLEVWRKRLRAKGGVPLAPPEADASVSHVFAEDQAHLERWEAKRGSGLQGVPAVKYEWLEKCLGQGRRLPEQPFLLRHASTHPLKGPLPTETGSTQGAPRSSSTFGAPSAGTRAADSGRTSEQGSHLAGTGAFPAGPTRAGSLSAGPEVVSAGPGAQADTLKVFVKTRSGDPEHEKSTVKQGGERRAWSLSAHRGEGQDQAHNTGFAEAVDEVGVGDGMCAGARGIEQEDRGQGGVSGGAQEDREHGVRAQAGQAASVPGERSLSEEEQEFWWREIFALAHWGLREKEKEVLARKGGEEEWWRGLIQRPAQPVQHPRTQAEETSLRDYIQIEERPLDDAHEAEVQRSAGSASAANMSKSARATKKGGKVGPGHRVEVSVNAEEREGEEEVEGMTCQSSITGDSSGGSRESSRGSTGKRQREVASSEAGPEGGVLKRVRHAELGFPRKGRPELTPCKDEAENLDIFFGPSQAPGASPEPHEREHSDSMLSERSGGVLPERSGGMRSEGSGGAQEGQVGERGDTPELSSREGGVRRGNIGCPKDIPRRGEEPQGLEQAQGLYSPPDLNRNLTEPFMELRNLYKDGLGEDYRALSYYKAVSVLEKVPIRITSEDHLRHLPNIGPSLRSQILEILAQGYSQRLAQLWKNDMVRTVALFGSVWGIGPKMARRLYDLGHRQLADLWREPTLTAAQRLSLKFHDDISTRILRADVAEMEALVRAESEALCPGISILCGGSYRRGKRSVGDMDFVATHRDGKSHVGFLAGLIERLKAIGFVTEDLMVGYHAQHIGREPHPESREYAQDSRVDTYFGLCCKLGRKLRHRIDFKVYPLEQYPYGLLAWTGNDVLNRRIKLLAESKGFKLDDKGIVGTRVNEEERQDGKHGVPHHYGCHSEREVFTFFGCSYLEPWHRNL